MEILENILLGEVQLRCLEAGVVVTLVLTLIKDIGNLLFCGCYSCIMFLLKLRCQDLIEIYIKFCDFDVEG